MIFARKKDLESVNTQIDFLWARVKSLESDRNILARRLERTEKCKECRTMDCAMRVMSALQFRYSNGNIGIGNEPNYRSALEVDRWTNEILISEELLMQAIILANPGQKRRRIRLITNEELEERRNQRTRIIKERPNDEP